MAILLHPVGFRWRFAEIARGQIGVREVGNNGGPKVRRFQSATWLAPDSWPWCAAFVSWCYRETCRELCPGLLPTVPATPRAFDFERWGARHGLLFHNPLRARQGDIIVFRHSHVGIAVQAWDKLLGVVTVEGNTNQQGSRDGDGVWMKHRTPLSIRSLIRIHESSTPQL